MKNILTSRLTKLQKTLTAKEIEAFLITTPANITYLTGVHPISSHEREAYLIITPLKALLLVSPLKSDLFKNIPSISTYTMSRDFNLGDLIQLAEIRYRDLHVEAGNLLYKEAIFLEHKKGLELESADHFVEKLRQVKDREEIENIIKACQITAQTWEKIKPSIRPGVTEKFLADLIISTQKSLGADGIPVGFEPIVASGANSAIPHHSSSHKKIAKNDVVLFDFGCSINGYASDFTRTIKLGDQTNEFVTIQNAVMDAYQKAVEAVSSNSPKQIDSATIDHFKSLGLEKYILHTTGHGLGLDIHEQPSISIYTKNEFILKPGMVITVEPGLYLSNKFGYRHENTIQITESGYKTLTEL